MVGPPKDRSERARAPHDYKRKCRPAPPKHSRRVGRENGRVGTRSKGGRKKEGIMQPIKGGLSSEIHETNRNK